MRKSGLFKTLIIGIAAAGVLLGSFTANAKKEAKYIGTEQCLTCHEGSHEKLTSAYLKTPHHKAMADVAKSPAAVVAKFDANSPIKKADIKYVLGTGRDYQNYLDKNLKVLPAKWDVQTKKWVKATAADGATQCVGCHTTAFEPATKKWTELGVGCEMCHGPGSDHADSMEPADINSLKKLDAKHKSMVCGQCHSVGTDTTGKYAFPTNFRPGDDLDTKFKLSKDYVEGAQNSQYNDFITSKHAEGGMDCTTCHDAHGDKAKAPHQLRQPVTEQCMTCHGAKIGSLKEHAPNAAPDATCATCHMPMGSHNFKKAEKK